MENQKDKFQIREGVSYINCAYMSPLMRSSEEKGYEGLIRKRNPFEVAQEDFFTDVTRVKELFGRLVNCQPGQVALFPSTSYGFASVLNNIKAGDRDHCILVANEFPSGYMAADKWAGKHGASLKIIAPEKSPEKIRQWNQDLLEAISEKTAFVLVSSVHWMDGSVFDLERIGAKCRSLGAKLIVDGTQSVGAMPMDVQRFQIDALICATYKWLFGPYSTAIGYLGECFENGEAIEESWMNRTNAYDFSSLANYGQEYFPMSGRYNVGETSDFIKTPMLIDSLSRVLEWQPQNIRDYCKELLEPLCNFMNENGIFLEDGEFQAGHLVGFGLNDRLKSDVLIPKLREKNIILSVRGTSLRVSPNVYNTEEDISKLVDVLKENIVNPYSSFITN